ncbi:HpcH/HpaI aldolase/citrate lyase family protein [Novosphingobium resinovorum]|uniref:Aldolase n=1 Tax=Novosphingobium resinovorum TaxID=158500 RepID=A0A031K2P3_9SPHN|nr:aldolase [Novosphingobium resinovorum]EZP82842.1 HpcH/HpaI aldolase/citrate lyase family protein [Novosphingobium resinovorum]MBF7014513.1 aldolase [Novosphingobium sp. HR1a]
MPPGSVLNTPAFRERLTSGELLVGTFVKTPSPIVAEVLSLTGLDCLCLDAEHAPFDRATIDGCVAMTRAIGMPSLVRIPVATPEQVLNALDCGATGVVAPHIRNAAEAAAFARACRFGAGGRGYAGSTRAACYTTRPMADHLRLSERETVAIAQIEDPEAVEDIDEIARVDGIDCLFVGRVDLTVGYGLASQDHERVVAAVERICDAGRRNGRAVGMFLSRIEDVTHWHERGASLFLLGSDHGFLLQGAADLLDRARRSVAV